MTTAGSPTKALLLAPGSRRDTDRLSRELVDRIADVDLVAAVLTPIAERLAGSGTIPYPNPIGVPRA